MRERNFSQGCIWGVYALHTKGNEKKGTRRNIEGLYSSFKAVLAWIQILLLAALNKFLNNEPGKLLFKTLILLIESGSMCKHQGSSEQSDSYATLSSFLLLNRTLCGIKHGSTFYLEKKKIIVQRRRGFFSYPSILTDTRKMET